MAKEQCNFPTTLDTLDTDRVAGQDILSATTDILETAVTEIEKYITTLTSGLLDATADTNIILKMGDAGGVNKIIFNDSGDAQVGEIDSDGKITFENILSKGYLSVGEDTHPTIVLNGTTKTIQFGVHGDNVADQWNCYVDRASDTHNPNFIFLRARGTHASPTSVADDDKLGTIGFAGYNTTAAPNEANLGASIVAKVHGTPGEDDLPTELIFALTPDGAAAPVDQITMYDGVIAPITDNDIDLGTSSLQFKNGYFTGTLEADAITLNGTALGSIYAAIAQKMNIGTTEVAINRASAALTLAGITLTTPNIGAATLGGTVTGADNYMTGMGRISFTQELDNGTKTANFSVDFATDQKQKCTMTANTFTLTLDTTSVGVGNYLLKIVNGGLATLTWASESGSIYFPSGDDPDLTSSGTDIVALYFDGTNWYGAASLDFS